MSEVKKELTIAQLENKYLPSVKALIAHLIISEHVLGHFLTRFQITLLTDTQAETLQASPSAVSLDKIILVPKYFVDDSPSVIQMYVLHEGLHVFLQHAERRGYRDEILWGIACDHEINEHIIKQQMNCSDCPIIPSSKSDNKINRVIDNTGISNGWIRSASSEIEVNMPAEIIYDYLKRAQEAKKLKITDDQTSQNSRVVTVQLGNQTRQVEVSNLMTNLTEEQETEIRQDVARAIQAAKMRGSGSIKQFEHILERTKVSRKCLNLIKQFSRHIDTDLGKDLRSHRTFTIKNKIIPKLPGVHMGSRVLKRMAVVIDESGSMSDDELAEIIYGLYDLVRNKLANIKRLTLIRHDTGIDVEEVDTKSNLQTYKRKFFGGTSHKDVFEFLLAEEKDNITDPPVVTIFITDACSDIESLAWGRLSTEKLWLITGSYSRLDSLESIDGIGRVVSVAAANVDD